MSGEDAVRVNMIERQLLPNQVTDARVIDAFAAIRRELFVPDRLRAIAYADDDLPLGDGRYLMALMVAAKLLQLVRAARGDVALVAGAGVCYEAALLSQLCRSVVALETDAGLARQGRAALVEHRIATVTVIEEATPPVGRSRPSYDVILFAGAVAEIPAEIAGLLVDGGRMAAVIKAEDGLGRATLTTRTGGTLASRVIFDAATPLLPGYARKPAFVF